MHSPPVNTANGRKPFWLLESPTSVRPRMLRCTLQRNMPACYQERSCSVVCAPPELPERAIFQVFPLIPHPGASRDHRRQV